MDDHYRHPDGISIRYWQEDFHEWDGRCYRPLKRGELAAIIVRSVKQQFLDDYASKGLFQNKLAKFSQPS